MVVVVDVLIADASTAESKTSSTKMKKGERTQRQRKDARMNLVTAVALLNASARHFNLHSEATGRSLAKQATSRLDCVNKEALTTSNDVIETLSFAAARLLETRAWVHPRVVAAREKARRRLAMAGVSHRVKAPVSFRIVKRKLPLVEDAIPASGIQSQDSVIYRV